MSARLNMKPAENAMPQRGESMKTFYGPVPASAPGESEVTITHDLNTTDIVAVTVWHLTDEGKEEVLVGPMVTGADTIVLPFAHPVPAHTYQVGIVAHG